MENNQFSIVGKNLHRSILKLALPGMGSSLLQTLYQLADAYWIGRLGAPALAAVGGCSFIIWAIFALSGLATTGTTAIVAQKVGAGKLKDGKLAAGQGMITITVIAIIIAIIVFLIKGLLFNEIGFEHDVIPLADAYLSPVVYGMIFLFWFVGLEATFRGIGDTKTPMILLFISVCINAVLDPFLIFGWAGMPKLGIAGAAWATVISESLVSLYCTYLLFRKNFVPTLISNKKLIIRWQQILTILKIGAPIAFNGFFFSVIYVFLTRIIAEFGTESIAAIGICHRIEGIAYFGCVGFSVAATTLVGQFIGANMKDYAAKAAWFTILYISCILAAISFIFYFYPDYLMKIFVDNQNVQNIGIQYLRIVAFFEIFMGLEIVLEGAFSGAGDTLPPILIMFPFTALRIPLAWYLAIYLNIGVSGIWWAIGTTTCLKGILVAFLFLRGKWKEKKL